MAANSKKRESPAASAKSRQAAKVAKTLAPKSKAQTPKAKSATPKANPAKARVKVSSRYTSTPKRKTTTPARKAHGKPAGASPAVTDPSQDSDADNKHGGEDIYDDALVVCGKEVCGRKLALWDDSVGDWRDGEVVKFKPSLREHLIRFLDRSSDKAKHEEAWFEMSKHRFRWLSPSPDDAAPNPSYRKAPKRKAAVGCQVKVFWTGMGKWYLGKVLEYDTETKKHTIKYRDGDVQALALRHEAVIYLDGSGGGNKTPKKTAGREPTIKKAGNKNATSTRKEEGSAPYMNGKDGKKRSRSRQGDPVEEGETGKKRANAVENHAKREQIMNMAVVGSRLGIYNPGIKGFNRGTVENYRQDDDKYQVLYDNGKYEWVDLGKCEFRYLSPKTRSGGCGAAFLNAMDKFGAEQMKLPGEIIHVSGMGGANKPAETISRRAPVKEACTNWRLSIRGADKKWYLGEIIAYHPVSDRHVVLYDDGEHEVVHLPSELIAWHVYTKDTKKVVYPGKPSSMASPVGTTAVGWRVAVFWPAERDFFRGKVTGYDEFTKTFDVSYDDGDRSIVRLTDDKIKWVLPPGTEYDTAPFKHRVEVIIPIVEEESVVVSEEKKAGGNKKVRQQKSARKLKAVRGGSASASPYGSPHDSIRYMIKERQEFVGEPVVVRNISSVPMYPVISDSDGSLIQSAIAVRIYLSDSSRDSVEDAKDGKSGKGNDDKKNNYAHHSVDDVLRRVGRAEESIVKGLPTYMPAVGEGSTRAPHRLDKLSLNPKMVMHRKINLGMVDNDSESDNLNNNMSSRVNNFSPSVSPKYSRFRRAMSPLGSAPKLPDDSSSGSSDDEEQNEDLLISPQEHHKETDKVATHLDDDRQANDIFMPNDALGPIDSPFGEPAIQRTVGDDLMIGAELMSRNSSGLNL